MRKYLMRPVPGDEEHLSGLLHEVTRPSSDSCPVGIESRVDSTEVYPSQWVHIGVQVPAGRQQSPSLPPIYDNIECRAMMVERSPGIRRTQKELRLPSRRECPRIQGFYIIFTVRAGPANTEHQLD